MSERSMDPVSPGGEDEKFLCDKQIDVSSLPKRFDKAKKGDFQKANNGR